MTAPGAPATLVGRRAEIAALTEVLDRARRGTGGALVLWGEPGIGKTALLDHVTAMSPDITSWRSDRRGASPRPPSPACTRCSGRSST